MADLTPTQKRFIELDKKKVDIKRYFAELESVTADVVAELGLGAFFQDEDGTVYKATKAGGEFVRYKEFEILRTRRENEPKGTLSLKEAQEAGFEVK